MDENFESQESRDDSFDGRRFSTDRRRLGRMLVAVSIGGVLLAVTATVLAWILLGNAGRTVDASLELTGETVGTGSDTVALISDALQSVESGLIATTAATSDFDTVLTEVGSLSDQASEIVGEDIPDGLDDARSSLPQLAASLDDIAGALEALAFVGIDIDVNPAAPVRTLDTRLGELSTELRTEAARLALVGGEFDDLASNVGAVEDSLLGLSEGIQEAETLLMEYRSVARDGEQLIVDARLDLDDQITVARLVVLLIGLSIALAQIAPATLGWYLMRTSGTQPHERDGLTYTGS